MTTLQISIALVLSAFGIGLFVVLGFGIRRIEAAIESVETTVHDRANHLVLDALADAKKAEENINILRAEVFSGISRLAENAYSSEKAVVDHVSAKVNKLEDTVIEHTKTAIHGAVAATATGVRNAICSACTRLSHTWHVIEGKVECKDCEIRRTTN